MSNVENVAAELQTLSIENSGGDLEEILNQSEHDEKEEPSNESNEAMELETAASVEKNAKLFEGDGSLNVPEQNFDKGVSEDKTNSEKAKQSEKKKRKASNASNALGASRHGRRRSSQASKSEQSKIQFSSETLAKGNSAKRRPKGDIPGPISHKAASMMGDQKLEKKAREFVPQEKAVSRKLINIAGEADKLAPLPARKRLGSEMGIEMKMEQKKEEMSEMKKIKEINDKRKKSELDKVMRKSTPNPGDGIAKVGVEKKAAAILGSEELDLKVGETLGKNAKINGKIMRVVGDANKLAPVAARKRLGSQMNAKAKAEQTLFEVEQQKQEKEKEDLEKKERTEKVINRKVKSDMLKTKKGLSVKAASVMGDSRLHKKALEDVSEGAQVNKKVLNVLGSAAVASGKARDMMGEGNNAASTSKSIRNSLLMVKRKN